MNIWFFLWLFLSAGLLYFFGWTLFILYRQKRAWQAFARMHRLRFQAHGLFAAPEVHGSFQDYSISLFTGAHALPDGRSARKMTALEIKLKSTMPFAAGIASGGMTPLVQRLGLREEYRPEHAGWKDSYVASGDTQMVLKAYLTEARLQILGKLMAVKNAWVIFVCREDVTLLRLDTPDPLDTPKKLEAMVGKMLAAARALELESDEGAKLKAEALKVSRKETVLATPQDAPPLELED